MAAILLLSGGRSSRMGQDKARLPWAGQTLLDWQRQRFEQAGFSLVWGLADRVAGHAGPLAGIDAACAAYPSVPAFLVLPVDMPRLSIAAVQNLLQRGADSGKPTAYRTSPLPLYLPNSPELGRMLEQWLADPNGPRSVYALVEQQGGQWLAPDALQDELTNINTPDQWHHFVAGESAP
ncbi:molybdenum cofactor guanylyltransferase [Reinekea sp.]|uniref:molybdenum cofactor guanylyltransferase n=1 Tax=Reinekea sp. TaxID=1970455 RepID=UPI002A837410|nr:molybdenum cofactor guanylyltransferase [Reinekea sp.]